MSKYILALHQATMVSRAILFDRHGRPVASSAVDVPSTHLRPEWITQDPETIWSSLVRAAKEVMTKASISAADVAAIGIANQRETTLLWDRTTGKPVTQAIAWQSRISEPVCNRLRSESLEKEIHRRTGLTIDPTFAGTKVRHVLDTSSDIRARVENGTILFGTIDTFLLWRLTGGKLHVTDPTNACRTLLYDIHRHAWDDDLLEMIGIPRAILPEVRPSSQIHASTSKELFGAPIPIGCIAGDQQAGLFSETFLEPATLKASFGQGSSVMVNTGKTAILSKERLLTTIAGEIDGEVRYCLEGISFVAGGVVSWLRDGLHFIKRSAEIETLAQRVPDSGGVCLVPAFVGLGAPHWDGSARGAILGLTSETTIEHIARAALESLALQTNDMIEAMGGDLSTTFASLSVGGRAASNDFLLQFQADMLEMPVRRVSVLETPSLGVAYMAGLAVGFWTDLAHVKRQYVEDRVFHPAITPEARRQRLAQWKSAVDRTRGWRGL
ncbi:Glycerol kinase [Planctomycetes bacterium Pan216]|uniref:ATP:glycerol 3-phosphotransferase n=1 Tax=Kolteria novifilia TaxID=2527975 RepID=A0A518B3W1_9BACT|nr:Glycerol kinase [Planctomycetes bacterium Pan216]